MSILSNLSVACLCCLFFIASHVQGYVRKYFNVLNSYLSTVLGVIFTIPVRNSHLFTKYKIIDAKIAHLMLK